MGCNCGNKGKTSFVYKYVSADGKIRKTYTSEMQARAAKIKSGGSYTKVAA